MKYHHELHLLYTGLLDLSEYKKEDYSILLLYYYKEFDNFDL